MGSRKVIYVIVIFLLVISIVSVPVVVGEEEDKHKVITEEEFQKKLENKDYDFSWCVFPFEVNLNDLNCTDANLSNAIFEEEVHFNDLNCTDANFCNATFEEDVYFENITFDTTGDNYTNFEEVTFKEEVEFIGISFEKGVKFDNAIFEGNKNNFCDINATECVYFNNVTFKKSTGIHRFLFKQGIDFSGSIFGHYTIFGGSNYLHIIKKSAIFENVTFGRNTTFMNVNFESAQFNSVDPEESSKSNYTIFSGYASFENVDFNGTADFSDIIFEGKVLFLDTTFKKEACFRKGGLDEGTIFKGKTEFKGVKFERSVSFKDAIFEDTVWFSGGTNVKNTTFGKEIGESEASFKGAEFRGQTYFNECIFNVEANFNGTKFYGDTRFIETFFKNDLNLKNARFGYVFYFKPEEVNIIHLEHFEGFGHARIKETDLNGTFFSEAYLSNVDFVDCKWPKDYKVYEETDENLNCSKLEKIYRNIKISFQNHGDNDMAGKFFYREMEMKREGTKNPLLYGYWILCGYGEKPQNVIFCSLVIIGIFAVLFLILGIEINNLSWKFEFFNFRENIQEIENRHATLNRIRQLGFDRYWILNYLWRRLSNFGLTNFAFCLLFSITSFSTLGTKYIKPKDNASRWLSAVESLIGMFFIALFIYVFARKMLR